MARPSKLTVEPTQVVVTFRYQTNDNPTWHVGNHLLDVTITNQSNFDLVNLSLDPLLLRLTGQAAPHVQIINTVPILWSSVRAGTTQSPDQQQPGARTQVFVNVKYDVVPGTSFSIDATNALTYNVQADVGNTGSLGPISVNP